MNINNELIDKCIKCNPKAQEELYHISSPVLYGICLRYAGNAFEANDILQDAFIKIFNQIGTYSFLGSFEGWLKRITVNTAINYYKAQAKYINSVSLEQVSEISVEEFNVMSNLSAKELLEIIHTLPDGYRIVFNLYAVEGYSHKEIADLLDITESTSKSQLSRARLALQKKIKIMNPVIYEHYSNKLVNPNL